MALILLSTLWTVSVLLLLSSVLSKNPALGWWGDVMFAVSYSVSSGMLIQAHSYWIGAGFAFPALRQVYVLIKAHAQPEN